MRPARVASLPPTPTRLALAVLGLALLAEGGVSPALSRQTAPSVARLAERAEAPPDRSIGEQPAYAPGVELFSMTGPDNGRIVRPLADVTGDGKPEVLLGIEKSGVPNVFALSGASSGTATVAWSFQTYGGASGGMPYGDECFAPASDVDANGAPNLLVGTAWGGRSAFDLDGGTGAVRWRFDTYLTPQSGWVYSLAEMSDVTGDGKREVAFGAGSFADSVWMIDGASSGAGQATVRWSYFAGNAVVSVRNLGDANGDGHDDVLAAVGDEAHQVVALSGGTVSPTGAQLWAYDAGVSVISVEVLPDLTGDGVAEALAALWTTNGSSVRCLNGATGALVWASTQVPEYGMMVAPLQDATGDGRPEVIVSSWENAVTVLNGATGALVWKTTVGTLNGGDVWTARPIADLDGDGRQDVLAGSFDYHVYALSGVSGAILWGFDTGNRVFSVHAVGDLNGDGRPEVAAAMQDTNTSVVLRVFDGDAGGGNLLLTDGFELGDTGSWSGGAI